MTKARRDRLVGTSIFTSGALLLILSWLVPHLVSDAVNRCSVVMSTSFYDQGMLIKAKCATVSMLANITWSLIFLGVVGMSYGLYALIKANRKRGPHLTVVN